MRFITVYRAKRARRQRIALRAHAFGSNNCARSSSRQWLISMTGTMLAMHSIPGLIISARMRMLVADIRAQWQDLDRRIGEFDAEFVRWAKENEDARRLVTIPGVGVTISTALIAAVGKAESFEHGRGLPAWPGLVPPPPAAGGQPRIPGIR